MKGCEVVRVKSCPFLVESELRCRANIYRIICYKTGKKVEYKPLTPNKTKKCRNPNLYPKCPYYRSTQKALQTTLERKEELENKLKKNHLPHLEKAVLEKNYDKITEELKRLKQLFGVKT